MAQNLHINGDGGYDTLHLAQGGNLDFTTVQNGMIRNIEHIEANNSAVNNITLNYDDVIAMTDSNNKLVLDVDAVDTVTFDNLGHGTTYNGTVNEGGETYHSYTSGGVTLLINTDITAGNITV